MLVAVKSVDLWHINDGIVQKPDGEVLVAVKSVDLWHLYVDYVLFLGGGVLVAVKSVDLWHLNIFGSDWWPSLGVSRCKISWLMTLTSPCSVVLIVCWLLVAVKSVDLWHYNL